MKYTRDEINQLQKETEDIIKESGEIVNELKLLFNLK